jgi:Calcineurin-like phosphoesterase
MNFDIIGDVHGHADALKALLRSLGYEDRNGAWRHGEGRRLIFVGDLIDRGPAQLETVEIARRMIDADTARIVMGNHEFNAVAFATPDPRNPGQHFRPRRGNNVHHHATFLEAVGGPDTPLHRELIDFFRTMPLWLDLPKLRAVHACWSPRAIKVLQDHLDDENRLTDAGFTASLSEDTPAYDACETILKGPEMRLPAGVWYRDAQGSKRKKSRTRWWDPNANTVRAACVEESIAEQLPEILCRQRPFLLSTSRSPCFSGIIGCKARPA